MIWYYDFNVLLTAMLKLMDYLEHFNNLNFIYKEKENA